MAPSSLEYPALSRPEFHCMARVEWRAAGGVQRVKIRGPARKNRSFPILFVKLAGKSLWVRLGSAFFSMDLSTTLLFSVGS
jgi:hypothetical protein